jgi:1-acyl-sn-glycerol-3-phosphate acyltransferase
MLYEILRVAAGIAVKWYYADIAIQGSERIPANGALVIIANHPNALIDALIVGMSVRRRILLTAKATLFEQPLIAQFLKAVGVVPLRRAKDESNVGSFASNLTRNRASFRLVTEALEKERAILIFPEGISHDDPSIAPLKSGASRMALLAHAEGVRKLRILPVGLVYEEKERPGSRVLVRVGAPLDVEAWIDASSSRSASELTAELDARLRAVTLNFATAERATRAVNLARTLTALAYTPRTVSQTGSLGMEVEIAARVDAATAALATAPAELGAAADSLISHLTVVEGDLRSRGLNLRDVRISVQVRPGLRFVLREAPLAMLAVIVAGLGRVSHWVPLRLARAAATTSLRGDTSRDQPAMRTVLFGLGFVIAWYMMLATVIFWWQGATIALLFLVMIFSAAHADRIMRGRLLRAVQRARTFLAFRADPKLQRNVLAEVDTLLSDALSLERALMAGDA